MLLTRRVTDDFRICCAKATLAPQASSALVGALILAFRGWIGARSSGNFSGRSRSNLHVATATSVPPLGKPRPRAFAPLRESRGYRLDPTANFGLVSNPVTCRGTGGR